jgi:hypothetical protein
MHLIFQEIVLIHLFSYVLYNWNLFEKIKNIYF